MKIFVLAILLAVSIKVVTQIESCADSGRCRVIFNDGTTDLLLSPYVGQKVIKQ